MSRAELNEEVVFDIARRIEDEATRKDYVEQACASDQALKARVNELLKLHDDEVSFLESPPEGLSPTVEISQVTEKAGESIGPYKLLQKIGEGGFGVVYMAEQTRPVRRKVALKIIKPGMDTKEVIARFESERQALALMNHPNIAMVFDGGETESGRPYFVMELVKGVPLTQYCDEQELRTVDRLKLFGTVCKAIQHAHQKGVIHRDIKPANVLVTLHDGEPVPKVIDFGVSKAINQQLTEKTLFTAYGQMVGTPQYMSPEQAEMSGLDVDTRSDIYSLGVLLYELLTGTTPLEAVLLRKAGFVQMQRLIKEQEPPKPSTRVSGVSDQITIAAKRRGVTPETLRRSLKGDLDWIVMKSLEKDRNRRYESANGLAKDVERYLNSEPVTAGPPTTGYRVRKFVARNRSLVASVVGLIVTLSAVLVVLFILYVNAESAKRLAERNEQEANRERVKAELLAATITGFLESASPTLEPGESFTVRQMLDKARASLDGKLDNHPVVKSDVLLTLGRVYGELGAWQDGRTCLDQAFKLVEGSSDPDSVLLRSQVMVWQSWNDVAAEQRQLSLPRVEAATKLLEEHGLTETHEYAVAISVVGFWLGYGDGGSSRVATAATHMRNASALLERLPNNPRFDNDSLLVRHGLAQQLVFNGLAEEGLDYELKVLQQDPLGTRGAQSAPHSPLIAALGYLLLGDLDQARKYCDQADKAFRQLRGEEQHHMLANIRAKIEIAEGKHAYANDLLTEAANYHKKNGNPNDASALLRWLGSLQAGQGDEQAAGETFFEAYFLTSDSDVLGKLIALAFSPGTVEPGLLRSVLQNLDEREPEFQTFLQVLEGKYARARVALEYPEISEEFQEVSIPELLRESLEFDVSLFETWGFHAASLELLTRHYLLQGEIETAIKTLDRLRQIKPCPGNCWHSWSHTQAEEAVVEALLHSDRIKEAEEIVRRGLKLRAASLAPNDAQIAFSQLRLASLMHDQGEFDEAAKLAEDAYHILDENQLAPSARAEEAAQMIVQIYDACGKSEAAGKWRAIAGAHEK